MTLTGEKVLIAIISIALIAVVSLAIVFGFTHECVRSHNDTCYTTVCSGKNNTFCTTTPYTCEVCDEWRKKGD